MAYIGAEVMISPLGATTEENWLALCENRSGISLVPDAGFDKEGLYLSKIPGLTGPARFRGLLTRALKQISEKIDPAILPSARTIVLISSTKGELDGNIADQFGEPAAALITDFHLAHQPIVVSNACISGVLAINAAANFINAKIYDHVIVIGCDLISDFVVYGFQSLFAISDQPCMPFDAARKGISMGEGCAVVVVSSDREIYKDQPLRLFSGASANDANHISGPSRTGEGLVRSTKKTMNNNGITASEIDFICAHGTATLYNDEMESIAFDRLNLTHIPLNSLKGYFGHTLGAAGVIETCVCMQMIRQGMLLKSLGFREKGTSKELNIVSANKPAQINTILKTASGFGGGNAALIIRKI